MRMIPRTIGLGLTLGAAALAAAAQSAHAAPGGSFPGTSLEPPAAPSVAWLGGSLTCETGVFQAQLTVRNPTAKAISGSVTIEGNKDPALEYSVAPGAEATLRPVTQGGFMKCTSPLRDVVVKVSGTAFPSPVGHTHKADGVVLPYGRPVAPPPSAHMVWVKGIEGNNTCGLAARFNVVVRNDMTTAVNVPVQLRWQSFDKTLTHNVAAGATQSFSFDTGVPLDCSQGIQPVRYTMYAGAGGAEEVQAQSVHFGP